MGKIIQTVNLEPREYIEKLRATEKPVTCGDAAYYGYTAILHNGQRYILQGDYDVIAKINDRACQQS